MSRTGLSFPKSSRILCTRDFRRVYDGGLRFSGRFFAAFCLEVRDPERPDGVRIGFTTPRALGGAVTRNRIRRRTREAVRLELDGFGPRWDIVITPRKSVLDASFAALRGEVRKLLCSCTPSSSQS